MNTELSSFAARLRGLVESHRFFDGDQALHGQFDSLALQLFALQFANNPAYQKICRAKNRTPENVEQWTQIPFVPTTAFKELELTSIPAAQRTAVFHSSGTTEQKPSRHFHCPESLGLYEASLWSWFGQNVLRSADVTSAGVANICRRAAGAPSIVPIFLTPPASQAPHSSLVHMFETVRQKLGASTEIFFGSVGDDSSWILDFERLFAALNSSSTTHHASLLFGTAFSFVHLLDFMAEKNLKFTLPQNSRVMETGGYKNRSRSMPKEELHALISERLGVPRANIICEYGMSELSSQAYGFEGRSFQFPPWARVQIISPETGREVGENETGLIRIFDLANVFSVASIQTEDLGIKRGEGFELIGRAQRSEPRGCSLMSA